MSISRCRFHLNLWKGSTSPANQALASHTHSPLAYRKRQKTQTAGKSSRFILFPRLFSSTCLWLATSAGVSTCVPVATASAHTSGEWILLELCPYIWWCWACWYGRPIHATSCWRPMDFRPSSYRPSDAGPLGWASCWYTTPGAGPALAPLHWLWGSHSTTIPKSDTQQGSLPFFPPRIYWFDWFSLF